MALILDCTTRDGGNNTNWNYSEDFVFDLMEKLNRANVRFYEIGYRNFYEKENKGEFYYCLPEFLKKFYEKRDKLELGVMVDAKRYLENDFINAKDDYIDFVRIACHPEMISQSLTIVESLYNKNYNVFLQLMEISKLRERDYQILKNWKNKKMLKSLYMADTHGIVLPNEIIKYYKKLQSIGFFNISFHGHNNNNQVLANSLALIKIGCFSIDTTIDGIGINGGNLSLSDILKNIQ